MSPVVFYLTSQSFFFSMLKINLVRSADCNEEILSDVYNLLKGFQGPIVFKEHSESVHILGKEPSPESLEKMVEYCSLEQPSRMASESINFHDRFKKRNTVSWEQIFKACAEFRSSNDIGNDEFVILLTSYNNKLNWFSASNPQGPRDHFVHTEDWDFFLGSDRRFPIAYQIASGILKKLVFTNYEDLGAHWHHDPRGCMLDFCQEKAQVTFKMRTGDICPDCLKLFSSRGVSSMVMEQVFRIIDGIRLQMIYKNRFVINREVPALLIEGRQKNIVFPDMGNLMVRLNPLEKALYLFFLNRNEGVQISHLSDYRDEIFAIYSSISNADNQLTQMIRINDLVNPLSNSVSEKISRIKRKFVDALGDDIAANFIISGENAAPRRIPADRSLIRYID